MEKVVVPCADAAVLLHVVCVSVPLSVVSISLMPLISLICRTAVLMMCVLSAKVT